MGLDIRKPIGLLFAILAAELLANEAWQLASSASAGTSAVNTWCGFAFAVFGCFFLWLGRSTGKA